MTFKGTKKWFFLLPIFPGPEKKRGHPDERGGRFGLYRTLTEVVTVPPFSDE